MKGGSLYAWQVREPDGGWSMVGALIPGLGTHTPLVFRDRDIALRVAYLANEHARQTNQELRMARFELAEVWDSPEFGVSNDF